MTATVGDVMTTSVVALHKEANYKDIVTALRRYRVSACPVIDETGRVIGLVSEADLLSKETDPDYPVGLERLNWRLHQQNKANALTAEQLMTSPAVAIHPWASVSEAAREMEQRQVKRLPVVDQDQRLVGIVTRSDVLSVYERPDDQILDDVTRVIMGQEFGLDPDEFEVTVDSGIVAVAGRVDRSDTALRLLARIRHAQGVVGVRDERLSYPRAS
jgi:CBS-domain-containing membrane protein